MFEEDYRNYRKRFPVRDEPVASELWSLFTAHVPVGAEVTGEVVARAVFGAWIDIGVGFPALLEIIAMADLTPEKYRAGEWCPVGSLVTARLSYNEEDPSDRRIVLSRR